MRKFNDIAKKSGPNAGGVRMLASLSGFVGNALIAATRRGTPCIHPALFSERRAPFPPPMWAGTKAGCSQKPLSFPH